MSHEVLESPRCSTSASTLAQPCRDILPADVWYIIFHTLGEHGRQWLYNACLVCRKFYALATPSLYRSLILGKDWNESTYNSVNGLLTRLDDFSENIRSHVREATILNIGDFDLLSKALDSAGRLPNLQNVILYSSKNLSPGFIEALRAHPRRPTLELLDQDGTMKAPMKLSPVSSLHAAVDVGAGIHEGPNSRLLALQELLFACPNLRSLSLSVVDQHDHCNLRHLMFPSMTNFHLSEFDVFPPIKDFSLNGYQIGHLEWPHWRDGFRWDQLSSLTLGPQPDRHNLGLLTGYVQHLRHFTLLAYNEEESVPAEDIDRFLMAFTTLVHLEIRGHSCSVEAVTNHPGLVHICLHECERSPEQLTQSELSIHRETLTAPDLELLHSKCPHIEDLEIDCNRRDGQWPEDILLTLATRFPHLRHLSIHLELGIANIRAPIKPVLNYASVLDIGQAFYTMRFPRKLQSLTIKTGEPLRLYSRNEPLYRKWEQLHSATFEIRPKPSSPPEIDISHVESDVLRGMRLKDELDPTNPVDLQLRVQAAVHGACASGSWDGRKRGLLGGDTPIHMHPRRAIPA